MRRLELGQTSNPTDLVPGRVGDLQATAASMSGFGSALTDAGEGLKRTDDGGWTGPAAQRFREAFDGEPSRWIKAGDAFNDASEALLVYSFSLEWAQGQAAQAIALWKAAEADTRRAKAEHAAEVEQARSEAFTATAAGLPILPREVPFHDPGEAKRQRARELLQRARDQLDAAGNTADRIIGQARDLAPPEPRWWQKVGEFFAEVGKGAVEATVGLAQFVWSISTVRMLTDPHGYMETVSTLAQSAVYAVQNPVEFGKAVLDWDTWKENPGRALGRLVPDLVLTAATAGGGAAVRGARGVKALDNLADARRVAKGLDGPGELPGKPIREVVVDSSKYPESARHIREAQSGRIWQGDEFSRGEPKPDVLHIDRAGADANRREALQGIESRGGDYLDRDEYPPATFREGGADSSVKYIDASDNRGAGSSIGHQIRDLPDGTAVRIVVK